MFTKRPEYQDLFKHVRGVPFEKLRDDPFLKRHSTNILTKLATVVSENLRDKHALNATFTDVAEHHVPRKVNGSHLAVSYSIHAPDL
jgi:hypothetical protein